MKDDKGERIVTSPAPKPIADCPNPECGNPCETDEFDSSHWVWCRACKYCGPETTLGEAEAIRLHNNICPAADWDVETAGIRHKLPKLDRA